MNEIEAQQDLGIRMPVEMVTDCLELRPQLPKIVNLTVEHQYHRAVLTAHRLRAGRGEVKDRQTAVS